MKFLLVIILFIPCQLCAQAPELKISKLLSPVSIRGLSVVDDNVIWMGGSGGTVCRSNDGGVSFKCNVIPGFDSTEFRSVYAFNDSSALVCNIGSPAKILKTVDAGTTWKEVYTNDDPAAFLDGIDFWNNLEGIVHGDPIDGVMLVLVTNDGGQTWKEPAGERPRLLEGEACFAASGTAIRCMGKSKVLIATGGVVSRLFISTDKGTTWKWVPTPIIQGLHSTGIFSFAFRDEQNGIIIGGDYKVDSLASDHIFLTNDGGNNWQLPSRPTRGYRECVEFITDKQVIAVGPSGIDISNNGGLTWQPLSDEKLFHVVRKARSGKRVLAAGGGGIIGHVTY